MSNTVRACNLFSAILLAVTTVGVSVAVPGTASAEVYTKREHINRDKCYRVRKVPAIVEYDTKGIKVRDSSRSWTGSFSRNGAIVRDRYQQEVYIQTRRVVEDEHTTLIPVSCR